MNLQLEIGKDGRDDADVEYNYPEEQPVHYSGAYGQREGFPVADTQQLLVINKQKKEYKAESNLGIVAP